MADDEPEGLGPPTFGELWRNFRDHLHHDQRWKDEHEDGHRWLIRTVAAALISASIAIIVTVLRGGSG